MIYFIIGVVLCAVVGCYTFYKSKELEYRKYDSEYARDALQERTKLDIEQEKTKREQEKTKQLLLEQEKEVERTKQLEIKANFKKEHNKDLW